MAHTVALGVKRGHVPALATVGQRIWLDRSQRQLILVLLVVLELDHPAFDDRVGHQARHVGVIAAGARHLQPLLHRVLAKRRHDLLPRRGQRSLRNVLADQIDGRDQRLGLNRQQSRRAVEVVAVGLRVDLDLPVLVDLGIQHVGAAAEVDDVEDVHVLAQLLLAQLQPLADLIDR